jgi:hypothetical protein
LDAPSRHNRAGSGKRELINPATAGKLVGHSLARYTRPRRRPMLCDGMEWRVRSILPLHALDASGALAEDILPSSAILPMRFNHPEGRLPKATKGGAQSLLSTLAKEGAGGSGGRSLRAAPCSRREADPAPDGGARFRRDAHGCACVLVGCWPHLKTACTTRWRHGRVRPSSRRCGSR